MPVYDPDASTDPAPPLDPAYILDCVLDKLVGIQGQLERIATALEQRPASGGGEGKRTTSKQSTRCMKQTDGRFRWEVLPSHSSTPCKFCQREVYFYFNPKSGKWSVVNADGYSHRDTCVQAGNPIHSPPAPEPWFTSDDAEPPEISGGAPPRREVPF